MNPPHLRLASLVVASRFARCFAQNGSINGAGLDLQGVVRVHIDPLSSGGLNGSVDPINPHLAFALPGVPPGVEYAKSETCATVGSEQNSVADEHEQREYTMSDSER